MYDLDKVFKTIIKQGLREDENTANKRGVLFLVRSKSHFTLKGVRGFVCGSHKALNSNADSCTHWTPNSYLYGDYTDKTRKYIKGHAESNLRQINTFTVDIDTKDFTVGEIILHSIDAGLGEPSLIVESDKGYHVYFALDKPIYITSKSDFKSLKVAKRISSNLKSCFAAVGADVGCNDFGFFRIPNNSNIVWFTEHHDHSMYSLINWSQQYDDSIGRSFKVLNGGKSDSVVHTKWIRELLDNTHIKGAKGQYGRNNIVFTLALSCKLDSKSIDECFDIVDEFNSKLKVAISNREVMNIIKSAYKSKYEGVRHDYISDFYSTYTNKVYKKPTQTNANCWYKFKKARIDRTRSHYDEWENDINDYLYNLTRKSNARFIEVTQTELCEAVGISRSTLNELVKQSSTIIKKVIGRGRNAITQWSTVAILIDHCIRNKADLGNSFNDYVGAILGEFNGVEVNLATEIAINQLDKLSTLPIETNNFSLII